MSRSGTSKGQARELALGYVAHAHGLKGELGIRAFDPDSETLLTVRRVLLRMQDGAERTCTILSARPTPKETLVFFEDLHTREAAEALRGATVLAFREDLPPPEPSEFFQGDLVGLTAVDEQGAELGTVDALWETGPVPNLVIRREGKELLVPFADEFVLEVDVAEGRLVVRPPQFEE